MSKRSIDEANQRVAATRVLEVSCEPGSLAAAVQGLLEKWNTRSDANFAAALAAKSSFQRWLRSSDLSTTRYYFLLERPDRLWVTFGTLATRVAARGFNPNDRGWLAVVRPKDDSSGTDNKMRILVGLAKWSVDDRRLIWNGGAYVQPESVKSSRTITC